MDCEVIFQTFEAMTACLVSSSGNQIVVDVGFGEYILLLWCQLLVDANIKP